MKKSRIFRFPLAVLLVAGVLSGCSGMRDQNIVFESALENAVEETKLTFFGFKYEALNVMAIEDALHSYMDVSPGISISYDGIKSPAYFDVLEKRLTTGNGDDIFMVDHERVLELGAQGKLADLSDLSTIDNFSVLAKSQMSAEGTIQYVPTSISAFGLYCNLDLLKAHGQTVPENLADFQKVCAYFVSEGIIPIVANNDISLKTIAIARALLPVYQSERAADEMARFNSGETDLAEELAPGFELVEQMLEHGWVDAEEAINTMKTKDDLVLFAAGQRPFMLTGAWAVPRLRELNPEFEFEVRPYPVMEDGAVLVINIDTRISVNADSPYVEQAKNFVEYMTQNDVIWEFVNSQSSFSPLVENRLAEEKAIQSIGPYLTNGRSVLGSDDNLRYPIWDMTRQCIAGMLEGDSVREAVSRMKEQIDVWEQAEAKE